MQNTANHHEDGVDLIRLLAMFLVVVLHLLGHKNVLGASEGWHSRFFWLTEMGSLCAVNLFALLSGYLLVFSRWKIQRYISLYFHVAFYTVAGCLLMPWLLGNYPDQNQWVHAVLLPFGEYWYVSAYACLLLIHPILNAFLAEADWSGHPRNFMGILLGCAILLLTTAVADDPWKIEKGYTFVWLGVMYLLGGLIRVNRELLQTALNTKRKILLAGVYSFCVLINWMLVLVYGDESKFFSYDNFFMTGAALCIFGILIFIRIPFALPRKIIRILAPYAFGVYLIHENPVVRDALIVRQFRFLCQLNIFAGALILLFAALSIFFLCLLLDYLRNILFAILRINQLEKTMGDRLSGMLPKIR